MRNVIALYRDERVLAPPDGFRERLYRKLGEKTNVVPSFLVWTLTAAAAIPFCLALFSAKKLEFHRHDSQGPVKQSDALQIMRTVAISVDQDDKVYHVAGCAHLHGKSKFISVEEALWEGYMPCAYCIGKARPKMNG
jgi:hypothetical protein